MLLRRRGVIQWDVRDLVGLKQSASVCSVMVEPSATTLAYDSVASEKVGTLPVDLDHVDLLLPLEDIQPPSLIWLACFWRLVVLEHDALQRRVGFGCEKPRVSEVRL